MIIIEFVSVAYTPLSTQKSIGLHAIYGTIAFKTIQAV